MSKPTAAKPSKSIFDPFNSSATGHQRAENRLGGSISWRDSRNLKLRHQFAAGSGGGKRVSDTVGAGSVDFGHDGRTENGGWVKGAKGLRSAGQMTIFESMGGVTVDKNIERPAKRLKTDEKPTATKVVNPFTPFKRENGTYRESSWSAHESSPSHLLEPLNTPEPANSIPTSAHASESTSKLPPKQSFPQIFAHLTIYINGSTAPTISDHKLKQLLTTHGAQTSISLGRRTVTHVILGRPNSSGGSGGGLAGSKIQKEIARVGGKGVKFVSVDWVLESLKAGKRLPESQFEALRLAPKGMNSVATIFRSNVGSNDG
ncbi:BRCT domain, a BRCA1 C-terminus domain [Acrodontium crateriforme]|uniref:BRCT domain, a BRCA1 C-terminus domain n=1 Tax=Acrodontium crateriforme TaxID=150365 RepID=A0AAQ3R489_9PEZI|nr:BRCT domain, a BRCA1 C-terminus domain [Acrodontium crateriforme]